MVTSCDEQFNHIANKNKKNMVSVDILESLQRTPHSPHQDSVCQEHLERNWSNCNRSVQKDRVYIHILHNKVNRINTSTNNKEYKWGYIMFYLLQ